MHFFPGTKSNIPPFLMYFFIEVVPKMSFQMSNFHRNQVLECLIFLSMAKTVPKLIFSVVLPLNVKSFKGAPDKYNIIPQLFPKKLGFLYH